MVLVVTQGTAGKEKVVGQYHGHNLYPHPTQAVTQKQLPETAIGGLADDNGHMGHVSVGQLLHLLHLGLLVQPAAEKETTVVHAGKWAERQRVVAGWEAKLTSASCRLGSMLIVGHVPGRESAVSVYVIAHRPSTL